MSTDPKIPVRQLMDKNTIFNNEDWRFIRQTDGEKYTGEILLVSRRPLRVSNDELKQILEANPDLRLATTGEFIDCHRPFNQTDHVFPNYQYPWGNNHDFSDATEPFVFQGVTRGGLAGFGPSSFKEFSEDGQRGGIWAVTEDGNRIGAPWNIHGEKPLEDVIATIPAYSGQRANISGFRAAVAGQRSQLSGERGNLGGERGTLGGERGKIAGERGNISGLRAGENKFVRMAGINANPSKELEGNEGYFLARKPNEKELEFFKKAVNVVGPRLSADNGITVLTPPNFETGACYFIPSGGCAECANQRKITLLANRKDIFDATGITIELPQEVHRYMDLMEKRIAENILPAEHRTLGNAILTFYSLSGERRLADNMITAALTTIPKDLGEKFIEYVNNGAKAVDLGKSQQTAALVGT